MEIANAGSATPAPEWRKRLDFAVQCVGFQGQLEAMQEKGSAVIATDADVTESSASSSDADVARIQAAPTAQPLAEGLAAVEQDAFGRTPEEARAQVSEWRQQEEEIDVLRRQMGWSPINRGYNADYNPQGLDLKTMQPHGSVPVDPASLAREQAIKQAGIYVNDTRQHLGKPIIEALGFDPDIIQEARRRAGSI